MLSEMQLHDPLPRLAPARVRVPASTSNLGPGFDLLGLALGLWLEVDLLGPGHADGHRIEAAEGTAIDWPESDNLLFRAFDRVLAAHDASPTPGRFRVRSEIPLERGLGSSGAAVAAGLLLGRACVNERVGRATLAQLGLELEGHPDNATAALFGGCTLGVPLPDGLRVLRPPLSPEVGYAVAWTDARLATERAREALPGSVPFADAVEQPRRLALLLAGLETADPELLAAGGEDRLHVAHRLPLVARGKQALDAAREAGAWLATISGAGSALVALGPPTRCHAIGAAMAAELARASEWTEHRALEAALEAPRVEHRAR